MAEVMDTDVKASALRLLSGESIINFSLWKSISAASDVPKLTLIYVCNILFVIYGKLLCTAFYPPPPRVCMLPIRACICPSVHPGWWLLVNKIKTSSSIITKFSVLMLQSLAWDCISYLAGVPVTKWQLFYSSLSLLKILWRKFRK